MPVLIKSISTPITCGAIPCKSKQAFPESQWSSNWWRIPLWSKRDSLIATTLSGFQPEPTKAWIWGSINTSTRPPSLTRSTDSTKAQMLESRRSPIWTNGIYARAQLHPATTISFSGSHQSLIQNSWRERWNKGRCLKRGQTRMFTSKWATLASWISRESMINSTSVLSASRTCWSPPAAPQKRSARLIASSSPTSTSCLNSK